MRRTRGTDVGMSASLGILVLLLSVTSFARTVRTPIHSRTHSGIKSSLLTRAHAAPIHGEEVVPGVMPAVQTAGQAQDPIASSGVVSGELHERGKQYKLRLSNLHTGESLDVVYRIGDVYIPEALDRLNYFLRDHNTQDVVPYEPKEFDVLHAMMARLGRTNGLIDVVCGYRTAETNEALRNESAHTGVAEHSQHMEGHAIDLRVPGVATARLRNAALSLHAGGVGYYPVSQFVHVDVGPVREWAFGGAPHRGRRPHRSHGSRSSGTTAVGE